MTPTQEQILDMAAAAGFDVEGVGDDRSVPMDGFDATSYLVRFAALVCSWRREQCAAETAAKTEALIVKVDALLEGIDQDDCESEFGWWETSAGAEFGAKTLADLKAVIRST